MVISILKIQMFYRKDLIKLKQNLIINTKLLGFNLRLQSTWGIFSPKDIDEGTRLLLNYIDINSTDICLDLGCGYGPIGLSIAKIANSVDMVDKDFIAIEFSQINAKNNNINNVNIYLSNGLSNLNKYKKFSHIISNVPAKVGREQLAIILYDAYDHMQVGAKITFVTINGLRKFIKDNFNNVFGNYKKIKQGAKYTVAQAIKVN